MFHAPAVRKQRRQRVRVAQCWDALEARRHVLGQLTESGSIQPGNDVAIRVRPYSCRLNRVTGAQPFVGSCLCSELSHYQIANNSAVPWEIESPGFLHR